MLNTSQHPQLLTRTVSGVVLADMPCAGRIRCMKDMPDWELKAGHTYPLRWDDETGPWLAAHDRIDLYTMSQSELDNLELI